MEWGGIELGGHDWSYELGDPDIWRGYYFIVENDERLWRNAVARGFAVSWVSDLSTLTSVNIREPEWRQPDNKR